MVPSRCERTDQNSLPLGELPAKPVVWGARLAPVPKSHSSMTVCLPRVSPEKVHNKGSCCMHPVDHSAGPTHGRVLLSVLRRLCSALPCCYCNNRSARPWKGGVWLSSQLPSLPGRRNPRRFSPPGAMWAPLFIFVAQGWRSLHGVEIQRCLEERVLQLSYPSRFSATKCGCGGHHFLCFHPSFHLYVAASVNLWLYFCSASVQLVIQDDRSIIKL